MKELAIQTGANAGNVADMLLKVVMQENQRNPN